MLNSFSLSNFKAFGSEQRIPLRPITLIFGANSSGKSSILHSLLLARHALDTGEWNVTHPKLAGDSVELGGFSNYLHRKDRNPVGAVSMSFDRALDSDCQIDSKLLRAAKELRLTLNIAGPNGAKPALRDCQIDVDGSRLFLLTPKAEAQMGINLWETNHPLSERLVSWCVQTALPGAEVAPFQPEVINEIVALYPTAVLTETGFLPADARFPSAATDTSPRQAGDVERVCAEVRRLFPQEVRYILADLHRLFSDDLGKLEYLGPLRSYPSRQLLDNETTDPNWRAGGGFAWKTAKDDEIVRDRVNGWLEQNPNSKYRLEVRRFIDEPSIRRHLKNAVADHDDQLITNVVLHEEKSGESLADEIGFSALNIREYVEAHPELHVQLLDSARQTLESSDMFDDEQFDSEDERQGRIDATADDWLANELGRNGMYWEEVRDHYFDNNLELTRSLAVSLSDPLKTAGSMADGLFGPGAETRSELNLYDLRSQTVVTHRDVGIGISQVLPVLVHAYGSKSKLIAIEQPEIHLHPALQAELGDLFIESALGENGNQFILETHSEHLLLRIMKAIRETHAGKRSRGKQPLRPDQISVLFVEPMETGSIVREMRLNERGELIKGWPGGFFEEGLNEMFDS